MKKLFIVLTIAIAGALAFTSCTKDKDNSQVTNTITIRGSKLAINMAMYAIYQEQGEGYVNFDLDAGPEATQLHGYGGFPSSWIGKTTNLSGPFFMSFNPMEGPSIDPVIKSGTVTITKLTDGRLHVVVDAVVRKIRSSRFHLFCSLIFARFVQYSSFYKLDQT